MNNSMHLLCLIQAWGFTYFPTVFWWTLRFLFNLSIVYKCIKVFVLYHKVLSFLKLQVLKRLEIMKSIYMKSTNRLYEIYTRSPQDIFLNQSDFSKCSRGTKTAAPVETNSGFPSGKMTFPVSTRLHYVSDVNQRQ